MLTNTDGHHGGMLDLLNTATAPVLTEEIRAAVSKDVTKLLTQEFKADQLRSPSDADRLAVRNFIGLKVGALIRARGLSGVSQADEQQLLDDISRRVLGMGFLDLLLPPARADIAEIAVDPFGVIWIKRKGVREFEPVDGLSPSIVEVETVFSNLLGAQLKAASEANPTVNAKLPRTKANPGGGRVKFIHPVIAPGAGFPSVNIRLFEPNPVKPEKLVQWGMLDEASLDLLAYMTRAKLRSVICGGTSSGKTTLLSMLCNFLPVKDRILTIEDPQEIWIENPHVVTLEARPAGAGSELKPYLLRDGVDDAMRMTPDVLIVGEVRDGLAAQALFRAMMSDHPGMSTFHAETPALAVERVALLLEADTHTSERAARKMFAAAVDYVVQIGFDRDGKRRVLEIVEVLEELQDGEVRFRPLVQYAGNGQWQHLGEPQRKRGHTAGLPRTWRAVMALDDADRVRYQTVIEARRAAFTATLAAS